MNDTRTAPRIDRILVPLDFSPASRAAMDYAMLLAAQLKATVRCVTIIDLLEIPGPLRVTLQPETGEDLERQIREWLDAQFAALRAQAGEAKVTFEVRRGPVDEELLRVVQWHQPDLVVMGSTGVGRRLPIGSRALALMRRSSTPVLVVRDPAEVPEAILAEAGGEVCNVS